MIIEIAEGAELSKPLEIRHVMLGGGLATCRNRVVAGKGVKADILEVFSGDDAAYQLNTAIDYRVADSSEIHVMRVINEGAEALHLGSTTVKVGADARFEHFTMSAGGKFIRSQSFVSMEGENSDADLFGASIVEGNRHSDITLKMDHAVPNCNSKEQYRTVLDDKAEGVFQGQIIVRQYAQKTDAKMMSQALLLSEDAGFFNKPELEIYADDVVCGHGATCGELDEDLLFYLRARGIPMEQAKKMLVMAFLAEAVENVSNEQFVEALETYILERLGIAA
ncbi:Fe-S cluster assembly protein SufD [uncultured Cohaesibacter sp.]|uniref:Fe-S cluster assembly protein SufD n=1 Tax=uncultured Cohaesibacter sp. TaxID=1002546 RepID=UPI00292FB855|nr:Fe-S cluster assembly protein SufD [uncultured Cohaesibacter sp.]